MSQLLAVPALLTIAIVTGSFALGAIVGFGIRHAAEPDPVEDAARKERWIAEGEARMLKQIRAVRSAAGVKASVTTKERKAKAAWTA